jgi:homoserine kinase
MKKIKVFAPAGIANIGPGFDIFGIAIHDVGDIVEATLTDSFKGVKLTDVVIDPKYETLNNLPTDDKNLVVPVGNSVYEAMGSPKVGVELKLFKRMGIGTGMGSSGSSSVAAAIAVNTVLGNKLSKDDPKILDAVLEGEFVACGSRHADNAFPTLLGGFIFIEDAEKLKYKKIAVGTDLHFVIISPNLTVNTRDARNALNSLPYSIPDLIKLSSSLVNNHLTNQNSKPELQSNLEINTYLQGTLDVLDGFMNNDVEKLGKGTLQDEIVTPVRAKLITGYDDVKKAALAAGAKGFSIAGSGPAVFAVAYKEDCENIKNAMIAAFEKHNVKAEGYISGVNNDGCSIVK